MGWIKLENNTPDKPEIIEMSSELGIDMDSVLGKVCRVWIWFDENTIDGITKSVTKTLLDRHTNVTGFCDLMIKIGWMYENDGFISLPNYDRHNSENAKSRALGTKRTAKWRKKQECDATGDDNLQNSVTETSHKSSDRLDNIRDNNIYENEPDYLRHDRLECNTNYPLISLFYDKLREYNTKACFVTSSTGNTIPTLAKACESTLQKVKELAKDDFVMIMETQIEYGNNSTNIENSATPIKILNSIATTQVNYLLKNPVKQNKPAYAYNDNPPMPTYKVYGDDDE